MPPNDCDARLSAASGWIWRWKVLLDWKMSRHSVVQKQDLGWTDLAVFRFSIVDSSIAPGRGYMTLLRYNSIVCNVSLSTDPIMASTAGESQRHGFVALFSCAIIGASASILSPWESLCWQTRDFPSKLSPASKHHRYKAQTSLKHSLLAATLREHGCLSNHPPSTLLTDTN